MQIGDYRADALTFALLTVSTGLWIHLLRCGLRSGWSLPLQPRHPVPWRPVEAVVTIMVVSICVTTALRHLFLKTSQPQPPEQPTYSLVNLQVYALSQVVGLCLIPFILAISNRCTWDDFGLRRQGLVGDLRFAIWGLLLAMLPVQLVEYPLHSLRAENPHVILELLQNAEDRGRALAWIAMEVIVLAPLIEELLFRVILQSSLELEIPPLGSIILTAVAFVGIHQWTDWIPLFPLALILGYVYHQRRSYLANVVLHGLFNTINLLCALWILKIVP